MDIIVLALVTFQVPFAYLLDCLVGDPSFLTHPVIWIGRWIAYLETILYTRSTNQITLRLMGVAVVIVTVGTAYGITWSLIRLAGLIHPVLAALLGIWIIATTIAQTSLKEAAAPIYQALLQGDLVQARYFVGQIVGRDTDHLDQSEVIRATVETVAENTVDGVTAPLFYALLGGAPLAMAYRAVNTLDSMLGYKNERYFYFGWAAARFDDLANYLPARLTGLVLPVAAWLCGLSSKRTVTTILTDASKHPSPNSGIMEAGFAGAMGIALGGENVYGGQASFRAIMGTKIRLLVNEDIMVAITLMQRVSSLYLVVFFLMQFYLWR